MVAVISSKTTLAAMPGNVFLPGAPSGPPRDSVVNVTALVTVDKGELDGADGPAAPCPPGGSQAAANARTRSTKRPGSTRWG